ncbi:MAG: L,D-transpeptidase [Gaiellaceae bacterium]
MAVPAPAGAASLQLSLPPAAVDWSAGAVTVSAAYPAGTKTVVFSQNGQPLSAVVVADPVVAGTISSGVSFRLETATEFGAEAFDALGTSLGTAAPLPLDPKDFVPSAPRLTLARGAIIEPSFTLRARSNRTVTAVSVVAGPEPLAHPPTLEQGSGGQIVVGNLRLPYGVEWLRLTVANGFGSSEPSAKRSVFELGPKSRRSSRSNYILVDKRSMTLYDIRGGRVIRHYEIAIGAPSTPTPNGYFKLGVAQRASGAWGVLRRPLYRFSRAKSWPTGFYIHGTDAGWSIGTWASHGCVRLQNWAIRRVSRTVPNGTLVLIRK